MVQENIEYPLARLRLGEQVPARALVVMNEWPFIGILPSARSCPSFMPDQSSKLSRVAPFLCDGFVSSQIRSWLANNG